MPFYPTTFRQNEKKSLGILQNNLIFQFIKKIKKQRQNNKKNATGQQTMSYKDCITTVYIFVDETSKLIGHRHKPNKPKFSDSELITFLVYASTSYL